MNWPVFSLARCRSCRNFIKPVCLSKTKCHYSTTQQTNWPACRWPQPGLEPGFAAWEARKSPLHHQATDSPTCHGRDSNPDVLLGRRESHHYTTKPTDTLYRHSLDSNPSLLLGRRESHHYTTKQLTRLLATAGTRTRMCCLVGENVAITPPSRLAG